MVEEGGGGDPHAWGSQIVSMHVVLLRKSVCLGIQILSMCAVLWVGGGGPAGLIRHGNSRSERDQLFRTRKAAKNIMPHFFDICHDLLFQFTKGRCLF